MTYTPSVKYKSPYTLVYIAQEGAIFKIVGKGGKYIIWSNNGHDVSYKLHSLAAKEVSKIPVHAFVERVRAGNIFIIGYSASS